jgi:hypothetical protein
MLGEFTHPLFIYSCKDRVSLDYCEHYSSKLIFFGENRFMVHKINEN